MVMIEISESKVEKMSDYAEKMVRYGGKLMQCLEELSSGESMGERWDDDEDYDDMVTGIAGVFVEPEGIHVTGSV